jgi:hypothetical protein
MKLISILTCLVALTLSVSTAESISPQALGMCVGSQTDSYNGDVITGGDVKDMETWDAKPYNSFAKWDTDASVNGQGVKFRVWLSEKATKGGELKFSSSVPLETNHAQCAPPNVSLDDTEPPSTTSTSAQFPIGTDGAKNLWILPTCTVGGQSLIVITITYEDHTTTEFQFVHTNGNPISIGTKPGADDIVSQGSAAVKKWNPTSKTPFAQLNRTDAYTESSKFYVTIPSERSKDVSYKFDYVPLGDADKRLDSKCTAQGGNPNACTHKVSGNYVDENLEYMYPVNEAGGSTQPFTVTYGCEVNGLVQIQVTLNFNGGYKPLTFSWIKECAFLPGLSIGSDLNAALNVGDVARQGDVVKSWAFKNETLHLDPSDRTTPRDFYFFLIEEGQTVQRSTLTSIDFVSTRSSVCSGGKSSLIVEQCDDFDGVNCGQWHPVPQSVQPELVSNQAPIRLRVDYSSICNNGNPGEASFQVTVRFDQYLVVQFAWTKAVGHAPGLSLTCVSGCSDDSSEGPILKNGIVTKNWESGTKLAFVSSTISSHFQFKTDSTLEFDYPIALHNAVPQFDDKYSCDLDVDHPLGGHVVPGKGAGVVDWYFYYWCRPTQGLRSVSGHVVLDLSPYTSVTYFFNKNIDFLKGFNVGTGMENPFIDNVNSDGTPVQQNGWGKDVNVFEEMVQSLDQRDTIGKDFYVSFEDDNGNIAFVPKPDDPADPYLGLFKVNLTSLPGCKPEVTVPSHPNYATEGASINGGGDAMHIQLRYNCDQSKITCEGNNCYAKYTGQIPVRYLDDPSDKNTTGIDKSTVLFRWMKWLKPVAPFRIDSFRTTGHLDKSVNLTWRVPLSGAGLDKDSNQLISTYIVNYTNASRGERKEETKWTQLILNLKEHNELKGKIGDEIAFTIKGLTNGQAYRFKVTSINNFTMACIHWSPEVSYIPGTVLPAWAWVLIVMGVVLFTAGGCFLYRWVQSNQKLNTDSGGGTGNYQSLDKSPTLQSSDSSALNNPLWDEAEGGRVGRKSVGIALDDEDRFNALMNS